MEKIFGGDWRYVLCGGGPRHVVHAAAMARSRSIADVHAARKTPGKARARAAAVAHKKTPLVAATASADGLARAAAALF